MFYGLVRTPADEIDYDAITQAIDNLEKVLAIADARLSTNTYIASSQFTLADIALVIAYIAITILI